MRSKAVEARGAGHVTGGKDGGRAVGASNKLADKKRRSNRFASIAPYSSSTMSLRRLMMLSLSLSSTDFRLLSGSARFASPKSHKMSTIATNARTRKVRRTPHLLFSLWVCAARMLKTKSRDAMMTGICAMCGRKVLDTKKFKMSS